jgi:hypothetical protein
MHGQTHVKFAGGLNTTVHAESTAIGVSLDVTVVYVNCEQVEGCKAVKDPVYCAAEDLLHVLR